MTFNWFDSQHVFTFYAHSSLSFISISSTDSNSDHKPKKKYNNTSQILYDFQYAIISSHLLFILSLSLSLLRILVFGLVFFYGLR